MYGTCLNVAKRLQCITSSLWSRHHEAFANTWRRHLQGKHSWTCLHLHEHTFTNTIALSRDVATHTFQEQTWTSLAVRLVMCEQHAKCGLWGKQSVACELFANGSQALCSSLHEAHNQVANTDCSQTLAKSSHVVHYLFDQYCTHVHVCTWYHYINHSRENIIIKIFV